jgi:anti-sigma factor RsiW
MHCERARDLIGPYLDGELPLGERRGVAAHLETCASCSSLAADVRRLSSAIATAGRELPPAGLAERVRARLEGEQVRSPRAGHAPVLARLAAIARSHASQAALTAAACLFAAIATWWLVSASVQSERLEQDVLAAHVRSLLQDSPIQVASSDAHTVKPWFAGRIDFAPAVVDLSPEGFPLIGGRLDYVAGKRVAAVVYKRRQHTISVFMWPSSQGGVPSAIKARNGYNIACFTRNALAYCAVSDLNASDLAQLESLL